MAVYSISDLEKLSGIKAHTIRIWEQRYGIVQPRRTSSNIRYYLDSDLKQVLNIALLNKNGFKISKIANMTPEEISDKVAAISEINFEHDTQLDALTLSMIEMDEYKFDKIISTNIQQSGFEQTMVQVILPFLEKLGLLWLTGSVNPVQENFITYLIRQKLIVAIDKEPLVMGRHAPKFVVFLPEGESQELSLLFMHYLLKSRRNRVVYLGHNVPKEELRTVHNIHRPDYLFTMISEAFTSEPVQHYIDDLCAMFPDTQLLFSGYQVIRQQARMPLNASLLPSLRHTIEFLENIRQMA